MGLLKTNLGRFKDAVRSLDAAHEKALNALRDEVERICKTYGLSFSTFDWEFKGKAVHKAENEIKAFFEAVSKYEDTFGKPWKRR